MTEAARRQLAIHGHFYQPPRQDPFTGQVFREAGAEPYHDFNEKITAECYRPNAELSAFSRISFDLGPTLASWLERHDRQTYRRILAQEQAHYRQYGCSNALAQVHSHAIMPLASRREKRIQVAWGLADFHHRFGHRAPGLWLAETAADSATLAVLADYGVGFTVLSPWQAAEPIDPTEPYLVRLADGRSVTVFFYHAELSGGVSFNPTLTNDAHSFGTEVLPTQLNRAKIARGEPQLLLVASDGELYGHHQPLRQHFLAHTLRVSAPAAGFEITSLARYLRARPPRREVRLREPSSWSCPHGVDRWLTGCQCTEADGSWKLPLRRALEVLAAGIDGLYEARAGTLLADHRAAEEASIRLRLEAVTPSAFWRRYGRRDRLEDAEARSEALGLLEALYYRHIMFASCAFFFEDLDRIEPRNAIASGLRAIRALPADQALGLLGAFSEHLSAARSWRTGRSGADLLAELLAQRTTEPDLVGVA
jgi:hypothetical protein